jgi:hypothetical protein
MPWLATQGWTSSSYRVLAYVRGWADSLVSGADRAVAAIRQAGFSAKAGRVIRTASFLLVAVAVEASNSMALDSSGQATSAASKFFEVRGFTCIGHCGQ